MSYAVYTIQAFNKRFDKLPFSDQEIICKIFLQLKENPYVGDAIRYRFFREKRVREKRIYYLIYEELRAVLIVAIGNKKEQQGTIDDAVKMFQKYHNYVKELIGI